MKSRVVFSSATVEWGTPEGVYQALNAEFAFDFDPCPLGGDKDGLATLFTPWSGRRVFINPPYRKIAPWLERAHEADVAVFLIPARTDTRWFHNIVLPHAKEIRFIKGRLKFGGAKTGAPFPSMIVVFEKSLTEQALERMHALIDNSLVGAIPTEELAELKRLEATLDREPERMGTRA